MSADREAAIREGLADELRETLERLGDRQRDVRSLLRELAAAREREQTLAKAASGLLWLDNNRHQYGTPRWLEFFDSAVTDARAALDATGGQQ